jgi:FixJ family two-component response regulator
MNDKLVCIVDDDLEVRDSLSLMLGLKGLIAGHTTVEMHFLVPTQQTMLPDTRFEDG